MTQESPVDAHLLEGAKRQLRALLDEIAALSRREIAPDVYFNEFLQRAVAALAAVGGAVWRIAADGRPELCAQVNLQQQSIQQPGEDQERHGRLLARVVRSGEPLLAAPYSGEMGEEGAGNPTSYLLIAAPLRGSQRIEALVEVFQRPEADPATQRSYLRFLLQMCEMAEGYLRAQQLQQYRSQQSLWQQADHFARVVHESLDPRETAYAIANESRRLLQCDRVSVALPRGRGLRIEAVSGQDTLDARSNTVVLLGKLTTTVAAAGQPLWYRGEIDEEWPPQITEALEEYVDQAHSKTIVIVPLRRSDPSRADADRPEDQSAAVDAPLVGAVVVEQIEDVLLPERNAERMELIAEHSARALANAVDHDRLFLMPLWRAIGKSRWLVEARRLPKTVTIASVVVLLLIAALVIPAPFRLKGRGVLQPVERRSVFVETPGVVKAVLVDHGDLVRRGDVLVELRNTDLDVQWADLVGQRQTSSEQLRSLSRMLLDEGRRLSADERSRLSGQVRQLRQRLASLEDQIALVEEKRSRLRVVSPIDGQIITWNVERLLANRPVREGQVLLTVADPEGEWELEVFMPERRMGHVIEAMRRSEGPLATTFVMAGDPRQTHTGRVKEMHRASELHDEDGQSVRLRVEIDKTQLHDLRPGGTATVRVHCGRRSFAYVWLHEVVEFLQTRVFF